MIGVKMMGVLKRKSFQITEDHPPLWISGQMKTQMREEKRVTAERTDLQLEPSHLCCLKLCFISYEGFRKGCILCPKGLKRSECYWKVRQLRLLLAFTWAQIAPPWWLVSDVKQGAGELWHNGEAFWGAIDHTLRWLSLMNVQGESYHLTAWGQPWSLVEEGC